MKGVKGRGGKEVGLFEVPRVLDGFRLLRAGDKAGNGSKKRRIGVEKGPKSESSFSKEDSLMSRRFVASRASQVVNCILILRRTKGLGDHLCLLQKKELRNRRK